MLSLMRLY